jgi:PII-like signaling protein
MLKIMYVGLGGFLGSISYIHTTKSLRLSEDLPLIIELVDTAEKIESFIPQIDSAIIEGLATIENVKIRLYRSAKKMGTNI